MEEHDLKILLRADGASRLRLRCPDEARLAAYADRRLEGPARGRVEAHLADCHSCLDQVAFLTRSAEWPEPLDVPARLLAGARSLTPRRPKTAAVWAWRWAATAAAACLLLAVSLIAAYRPREPEAAQSSDGALVARQQGVTEAAPLPHTSPPAEARNSTQPPAPSPRRRSNPPQRGPARPPAPVLRGSGVDGLTPKLLFPHNGAVVGRGELEVRWQPVADAAFYEVFVVTAAGDLVLEKKSETARLKIPSDIPLESGAKYFIWVRAQLLEGKTAKSGVVSIRVRD